MVRIAHLVSEEFLPDAEGGLDHVLLGALHAADVGAADGARALGQELQRVQARPHVVLRPLAKRRQRL